MGNLNQLKAILNRKVKDSKSRYLDINIGDISREMGCSVNDVEKELRQLLREKEIKALNKLGFSNEEYTLTILENSSILKQ